MFNSLIQCGEIHTFSVEKYAVIVSWDKQESAWTILSWRSDFEIHVITVPVDLLITGYTYLRSKEAEGTCKDK